jgi:hypothetical protein
MSEKNFWHLLRNSLPLKMYRVENKVMRGMPDIHYINKKGKSGWIELKYIPNWPEKRVSTGLALNQVLWLNEYKKYKGRCWILIRIGRDFIGLINGEKSKQVYNRVSKVEFSNLLHWYKKGNMSKEDWRNLSETISSEN